MSRLAESLTSTPFTFLREEESDRFIPITRVPYSGASPPLEEPYGVSSSPPNTQATGEGGSPSLPPQPSPAQTLSYTSTNVEQQDLYKHLLETQLGYDPPVLSPLKPSSQYVRGSSYYNGPLQPFNASPGYAEHHAVYSRSGMDHLRHNRLQLMYGADHRGYNEKRNRLFNFSDTSFPWRGKENLYQDPYCFSPMCVDTSMAPLPPRQCARKICKTPFKVLDAPELMDDFYLHLVDWSSSDILAVGLGSAVYLWSACTSKVTKLLDVDDYEGSTFSADHVTSVSWNPNGTHLAVGIKSGTVEIWDATQFKLVKRWFGHNNRVGTMAWNGYVLSTGSRDQRIVNRDMRQPDSCVSIWHGHRQEVCGLRWSPNERHLGSGGNDNKVVIWQQGYDRPLLQFSEHNAAVKALAWSPHQNGLLASGGGTADRCIRFWNSTSNQALQHVDTGSQVCNIAWSKSANELVSTHGYSLNQIILWKYPSLQKISTLTGHTYRVLYLAVSPNGQIIVTGAADETLRFWNVFAPTRPRTSNGKQEMRFTGASIIR